MSQRVDTTNLDLRRQLEAYLFEQVGRTVSVASLNRLAGGASNETWSFDARIEDGVSLPLVMRKAFDSGLLDESMGAEFALMSALYEQGTPVPKMRWYESADDSPFGGAFMIMDRAMGIDIRKAMARGQVDVERMGPKLAAIQAQIHSLDYRDLPIAGRDSGNFSLHQLEVWTAKFQQFNPGRWPLLSLACNWLAANVPELDRPVLVHGDFKANNLLCDREEVTAVIDWEMAHIGDPVEDLAWTMLWKTPFDLVGGMLSESAYVSAYEEKFGQAVAPSRLMFWRIFSWLKLGIIFLSGLDGKAGKNPRPVLLQLGRSLAYVEQNLADSLLRVHDGVYEL